MIVLLEIFNRERWRGTWFGIIECEASLPPDSDCGSLGYGWSFDDAFRLAWCFVVESHCAVVASRPDREHEPDSASPCALDARAGRRRHRALAAAVGAPR